MNGIVNLLKPPGMSSAQAVYAVKGLLKEKVGHAGTLDPEAAGVLPLMVGRAAKLFDYIAGDSKVYLAEIAFGSATDTEDAQGAVTQKGEKIPSLRQVEEILPLFSGAVMQRPPMFSALKRGGETMYQLARRGVQVELQPRPVSIGRIELLCPTQHDGYMMRVYCGKGTYIRSLCRDIGEKLGTRAHMRFLLRERVGAFSLDEAVTLDDVRAAVARDPATPGCLASPDRYLTHLPAIRVGMAFRRQVLNGVPIAVQGECHGEGEPLRAYLGDMFVGIAQINEGRLSMRTLYALEAPSA